jgi:hypothetical protein
MPLRIEWSALPDFEFWMLKYFHFALEVDSPIMEAIAYQRPVKRVRTSVHSKSLKKRYHTRYILPNNFAHCVWGPSAYGPSAKIWTVYGILHRVGGPAIECRAECSIRYHLHDPPGHFKGPGAGFLSGEKGSKFWLRAGKLHRPDGPAVEHLNDYQEWWVEGVLQKKQYQNGTERYFMLAPMEMPYSTSFSMSYATQNYILHRDDGPAEIAPVTTNMFHRPSVERVSKWYQFGVLHRLDGPAIIGQGSDSDEWWIKGNRFTRDEYRKRVASLLEEPSAKRQKLDTDES